MIIYNYIIIIMPLHISLFRQQPEVIKESQRRRFADETLVDQVIELDKETYDISHAICKSREQYNKLSKEIGMLKKSNQNSIPYMDELVQNVNNVKEQIAILELDFDNKNKLLQQLISKIGNILHNSVIISKDEADNEIVATWGDTTFHEKTPNLFHHHQLLHMIDGFDHKRGVKIAGHRGYFLKGIGVLLNQSIINYALSFATTRGFTPIQTPFFMRKDMMAKTAQLSDFDEALYKVDGGHGEKQSHDEYYLIATSEQPISCMHADEWLNQSDLPLKYAGYSTNFRKEAGAAGKDTWGIFRVHQFEKVEQFVITTPEKSWEMHEEMIGHAKAFNESLGIPYRVVSIVSKELNDAAAKKYDLEGYFPARSQLEGKIMYRELVSCSNCTDYQSRALNIRMFSYGNKKEKLYVHMLNSTLCATSRTLSIILENNQTPEGIVVPQVLRPFLGGLELIKYVKAPPKPDEM